MSRQRRYRTEKVNRPTTELLHEIDADTEERGKPPTHEQKVRALAAWHATPSESRCSLNELAAELGINAHGHFYKLARSAEVYQELLVEVAGNALGGVA